MRRIPLSRWRNAAAILIVNRNLADAHLPRRTFSQAAVSLGAATMKIARGYCTPVDYRIAVLTRSLLPVVTVIGSVNRCIAVEKRRREATCVVKR